MKYAYSFFGGPLNHVTFTDRNDAIAYANGKSADLTEIRKRGGRVHRPELDNQPTYHGYLGPMWDGERMIDGEEYYVLRYETQEVYDMLSR